MANKPRLPEFSLTPGGLFVLNEDWLYWLPWRMHTYVFVPRGYATNFASIPWWARWLISPIDRDILVPALVHDWLVQEFGPMVSDGEMTPYPLPALYYGNMENHHTVHATEGALSWDEAAGILRKSMESAGAPTWKRMIVFWSVRIYGWFKRK